MFDEIPSVNSLPQDSNPAGVSASLPDANGAGWTDTATKLLGTILNYQVAKDQAANTAQLNAHASTVTSSPVAALGGVSVTKLIIAGVALLGIAYVGKRLLA